MTQANIYLCFRRTLQRFQRGKGMPNKANAVCYRELIPTRKLGLCRMRIDGPSATRILVPFTHVTREGPLWGSGSWLFAHLVQKREKAGSSARGGGPQPSSDPPQPLFRP
jgi:hypothetical protein